MSTMFLKLYEQIHLLRVSEHVDIFKMYNYLYAALNKQCDVM